MNSPFIVGISCRTTATAQLLSRREPFTVKPRSVGNKGSMSIVVPREPSAKQFEDLVAALYQSTGHFTETNPRYRHVAGSEMLEIDVIATRADDGRTTMVEAKSGRWGFPDLFKLYGQMMYLGLESGVMYHLLDVDERKAAAFDEFSSSVPVRVCQIDPSVDIDFSAHDCVHSLSTKAHVDVLAISWYAQIAKRIAYEDYMAVKKTAEYEELEIVARYWDAVHQSFFENDPARRVRRLYKAYLDHPKLTAALVDSAGVSWDDITDGSGHPWIQYVMHLEHIGRLLILHEASRVETPDFPANPVTSWGDIKTFHLLPVAFQKAARTIQSHDYGERIPYLFQVFIEILGGFIHLDEEKDTALLSELSGIPENRISECLLLIDELFPFGDSSWFYEISNSSERISALKLVPGYLRGAGAFMRRRLHEIDDYREQFHEGYWLLGKWHNSLYGVIAAELRA